MAAGDIYYKSGLVQLYWRDVNNIERSKSDFLISNANFGPREIKITTDFFSNPRIAFNPNNSTQSTVRGIELVNSNSTTTEPNGNMGIRGTYLMVAWNGYWWRTT